MSKTDDIPSFVDEVKWIGTQETVPQHVLSPSQQEAILSLPYTDNDYDCQHVIDMKNVCIRYGERTILKDLNWTVCNGERWALSGQNGSGKSTLLSLVCADNPQSYACDITLFDRPRGSGESIWDIKKHIGYVSPEMHRSYKRNLPAIRIVASGLMDSIGLYAVPNEQDYDKCRWWLDVFGIGHLADKPFLQISSGEQRLVLLARAFVKDPQLLILDEPLHGLDLWNRRLAKDIIETFCQRRGKTLIMVTHYQEELPNIITNHLFLKKQI
jgi:molybdate transport system ATP-binding protein